MPVLTHFSSVSGLALKTYLFPGQSHTVESLEILQPWVEPAVGSTIQ